MNTNTAVTREVAWLTAVDTLPSLLVANGGPWKVVQAYWPGARFAKMQTGLYVMYGRIQMPRFGGQRIMPGYVHLIKAVWPVTGKGGMSPLAEGEQQKFSDALELLLERVNGMPFDKSHGGRFLSAGETVQPAGGFPEVVHQDPEVTIPQGWLRAQIQYAMDDFEIQN